MAAHAIDGTLGVDLDAVVAGTTTDGVNALFALGTRVKGTDGTEWCYVQAGAAVTQYDCVGIDENYQASPMTKTIADDGWLVGFAQVAFADNELGWVALEGSNIKCRLKDACAPDVTLYSTGSAGMLDDTSASQTAINGVVAVTVSSASGDPEEVIATNPWSAVAT
jgi:hypothetical protein